MYVQYIAKRREVRCQCDVSLHHIAGMHVKISAWKYVVFL